MVVQFEGSLVTRSPGRLLPAGAGRCPTSLVVAAVGTGRSQPILKTLRNHIC